MEFVRRAWPYDLLSRGIGSWPRPGQSDHSITPVTMTGSRMTKWPNTGLIFFSFFFLSFFLGPHLWHKEAPRQAVKSELQLSANTTATPDLSRVCEEHHGSWQCRILNPMSEARDQTCILMNTSWVVTTEPQWELPWQIFYIISYTNSGHCSWEIKEFLLWCRGLRIWM